MTLSDSIQDIRQYLLESPETVFVTSYHLELNGEKINDFIGLEELPELKDSSSFYVIEGMFCLTVVLADLFLTLHRPLH